MVGGYYYAGVTVKPLRKGLASMVIDARGHLSVVRWTGSSAGTPGLQAVRQNMRPLVEDYVPQTTTQDRNSTWGWLTTTPA